MPDSATLSLFFIAALALLLTPGPAVLYIITRSVDQGRTSGVVSTLGLGVGNIFHVAAAALGLSAILMSSALAFNVVKYLGAAYLIYLGVRKLISREVPRQAGRLERKKLSQVFYQGAVVNLLNPKTALFFLAFLPQFVNPSRGSVTAQVLTLGLMFVALGIACDSLYALLAGALGGWLRSSTKFLRAERYFAGSVYIGLGVTTALSGSNRK